MDVSIPSQRDYPRNKDRHFKVTPAELRGFVHQIEAVNKGELWISFSISALSIFYLNVLVALQHIGQHS